MAYKRILTIQDISCVGQCSMTVALPVLSACGHETCILPTALLSTHTGGFGKPVVAHLDETLPDIWHHWQDCGITFDAILVGYLGSISAAHTVIEMVKTILSPGGILIVDPAMGDNGKLYSGFDMDYAREMKHLCCKADIILPNITEAAILSGMEYREKPDNYYVNTLLDNLEHPRVVLTGVSFDREKMGVILRERERKRYYFHKRMDSCFHGTGDLFAACFTGALMQGRSYFESVQIAADFAENCIENTFKSPEHWYGIKFEPLLTELMRKLNK